jgi:hypothetical protein
MSDRPEETWEEYCARVRALPERERWVEAMRLECGWVDFDWRMIRHIQALSNDPDVLKNALTWEQYRASVNRRIEEATGLADFVKG